MKTNKKGLEIKVAPRQEELYECGPACVLACLLVCGTFADELLIKSIKEICQAKPNVGTSNENLVKAVKYAFNTEELVYGEDKWSGNLAIANILNPVSRNGHFVVFLGRNKNGSIRYYDPFWGCTFNFLPHEIIWVSGDGLLKNWCIEIPFAKDKVWKMSSIQTAQHPAGFVSEKWALLSINSLLSNRAL